MAKPYDPLNFEDMIENTQDEADPEFTIDWDVVKQNAEDQSDEDGHGNPMPESELEPGATLPSFLRQP